MITAAKPLTRAHLTGLVRWTLYREDSSHWVLIEANGRRVFHHRVRGAHDATQAIRMADQIIGEDVDWVEGTQPDVFTTERETHNP